MLSVNTKKVFDNAISSAKKTVQELQTVVRLNNEKIFKNDKKVSKITKENTELSELSQKAERISNKLNDIFELE